jgi:hypothetical protein
VTSARITFPKVEISSAFIALAHPTMTKPKPQKMSTIEAFFCIRLKTHNSTMLTTMTKTELSNVSVIMRAG